MNSLFTIIQYNLLSLNDNFIHGKWSVEGWNFIKSFSVIIVVQFLPLIIKLSTDDSFVSIVLAYEKSGRREEQLYQARLQISRS